MITEEQIQYPKQIKMKLKPMKIMEKTNKNTSTLSEEQSVADYVYL